MTISGSRPVRSESRRISSRWASVSWNREGGFCEGGFCEGGFCEGSFCEGGFFAGAALDRFPNVLRGVFAIAAVYHGPARSAAAREEALSQLQIAEQDHRDQEP